MTNKFNYNFINKTIEGSKTAIAKANKGQNPEYAELTTMLSAHPDFAVVEKVADKESKRRSYKNLSINRMEEYIRTQFSDKDELNKKLVEFESIQKVAKAKGAMYPLTEKWFLHTYPEFKESEVTEAESDKTQKVLLAAAAQLDALGDDLDEYEEETAA